MHLVACVCFDAMAPFELGVVAEVFALDRPELGDAWEYEFVACTPAPGRLAMTGGLGLDVAHGLEALARADTIVLPASGPASEELLDALRDAHARGARLVSICSGAFVLAATGLLDGAEAATHWRYAAELQARFPAIRVRDDVLFCDGETILTSAGTAAGIDLCLHLVRRDLGAAVANRVARRMVVAPHRDGGQAQFVEAPVPGPVADDPVAVAMRVALERIGEPLSLADLARAAHVSERTLTRRFRMATGTSPARWLLKQRVAASLPLLESGDLAVEDVGARVGIASPAAFRRHFKRTMGTAPSQWRRRFAA